MVEDDLEPLITRCPNCATQFRVTESQLAVASGRVRCGACLTVFQGTEHLQLDEETHFSSDLEADAALDELLVELGGQGLGTVEREEGAGSLIADALPGDDLDEPRLYGGFEDEGATRESEVIVEPIAEIAAEDPQEWAEDEGDPDGDADGCGETTETEPDDAALEDGWAWAGEEPEEIVAAAALDAPGMIPSAYPVAGDEYSQAVDYRQVAEAPAEEATAAALESADETEEDALLGGVPPTAGQEKAAEISFAPEPRRWWVGAVAGIFVLALFAQVFYFQLPTWSRDPSWRPLYETACAWFGCVLPEMRDLKRMRTRNLAVRSHPDLRGALVVDAVIVNEAGFEQAYPDLELRFTAVNGSLVAGRRFAPGEYLAGEAAGARLMPAATPVQVSLAIEDPGPDAVNYTLSFR